MKQIYLLALLVLAVLPGDVLRFESREGLVIRKVFESRMALELVESTWEERIDGEEQEVSDEGEESRIEVESRLVFVDEILQVEEGRTRELARTYEDLTEETHYTFSAEGIDEVDESEAGESELEGRKVLFAWNEDESRYEPAFPEGKEADAELLEGLDGETDLLALLPDGEIEAGDTWSVDLSRWRAIDEPGGDLKILAPSDEMSESADEEDDLYYENLEGELEARYEGEVEREGRTLAHVVIEGSLTSSFEVEPDLAELEESGFEGELSERTSFAIEVSGDLYWDTSAGRAVDLRVVSELRFTVESEQSAEYDGERFESKSKQVFEGESVLEAHFEVGD